MIFGWRLFLHSVRQLLLNIVPAIQISLVPAIIVVAAMYGLLGGPFPSIEEIQRNPGQFGFSVIIVFLIAAFCFMWVAVAWHRFVLLNEYPTWIGGRIRGDRMLSYLGASFLIGILAIVLFFAVFFVVGFVLAIIPVGFTVGFIIGFAVAVVLYSFITRLSMILPAAALGEQLGVGGALEATRDAKLAVLVLVILVGLLSMIPNLLISTPLAPMVNNAVYQIGSQWLISMLGVSILTTLYGHFVEKRDLLA